jgi:heptaprenyl diphosphate synthase
MMNTTIEEPYTLLYNLFANELERLNEQFSKRLEKQKRYLTENEVKMYLNGKKLRPLLLILSAKINSEDINSEISDRVIKAAVSLEMLHIGTLIHDDIIDTAETRRGIPSINFSRGKEVALLMGDLQIVESMRSFIDCVETQDDIKIVKNYLNTAFSLCTGELDELTEETDWATEKLRERYLKTIDRKTGKFFALACDAGAKLVKVNNNNMNNFGMYFGRMFQLIDDLLDITESDKNTGKKKFTDLANRRITLPIIYAMEELTEGSLISKIMKGHIYSSEEFTIACEELLYSNAIIKSYSEARVYALKALKCLESYPDSEHLNALKNIISYTVNQGCL